MTVRSYLVALLIIAALLVACSAQISKDDAQRINILYTHTRMMINLTSPQDMQEIGLHPAAFTQTDDPLQRLVVLEATMGLRADSKTIPERISAAESRMSDLMVAWEKLQK